MSKPLNIVAIAGSLRDISYTRFAIGVTLRHAKELGASVECIDLREYDLPFCEQIKNNEDFPKDYFKFKKKIDEADILIWGTPEYHGSYSGVLKNAIDLIGRKEIENKLIGLIGVAGGNVGATNSLNGMRLVARHLRAWVVPHHVSIPSVSSKFDLEGNCIDENIKSRLIELAETIVKYGALLSQVRN